MSPTRLPSIDGHPPSRNTSTPVRTRCSIIGSFLLTTRQYFSAPRSARHCFVRHPRRTLRHGVSDQLDDHVNTSRPDVSKVDWPWLGPDYDSAICVSPVSTTRSCHLLFKPPSTVRLTIRVLGNARESHRSSRACSVSGNNGWKESEYGFTLFTTQRLRHFYYRGAIAPK